VGEGWEGGRIIKKIALKIKIGIIKTVT